MTSLHYRPPASHFDEHRWVMQIRTTLDEELEDEAEVPVSIYSVHKALMEAAPSSYFPQQVAIGPYHCFRQEMYEMERYKLAAAKRTQQHFENLKFEDVVHQLRRYDRRVRACYHKYLTVSGETLAWMMAVDACFLLEFLQIYALGEGKILRKVSSEITNLVDVTRRKSAHNAILRDIMMLENQIPLFVPRKMLETKFGSLEMADTMLFSMLMGLFKVISPFKMMEELTVHQVMECHHIVDVLYHLTVRKLERSPQEIAELKECLAREQEPGEPCSQGEEGGGHRCFQDSSYIRQLVDQVWKILSKIQDGPMRIIKKVLFSKAVMFLTKLPWTIISNLPGIKVLAGPIISMFFSDGKKEKSENEDSPEDDKPPMVEEIRIPSVTQLSNASVNFVPTAGGISSIKFDRKTLTFYLPSISLDENTETIMRNLVAYEGRHSLGPVIISRYTELMNGIIDTADDARLLRESGIIVNRLKSDEDALNIWNGMNRSIRLTREPLLDKVIEDVNKFYSRRWKVKLRNFMRAYVFGSWQVLTFLACIALLLLMSLQAFCSVYNCHQIYPAEISKPIEQGQT